MKFNHFHLVLASVCLLGGCHSKPDWVDLGVGPELIKDFKYRLEDVNQNNEAIPKTHSDLTALTLDLQAGKAQGKWVYLPLYECWAPKLRDGLSSVACYSENRSEVIVVAADNVREILLELRSHSMRADTKAKAVGIYADSPMIYVEAHNAKMPAE